MRENSNSVSHQKLIFGQKKWIYALVCDNPVFKHSCGRLLVIQRIRAKYGSKAAMKENRNAIHS